MITTRSITQPLANNLDRFNTINRMLEQVLPDGMRAAAPAWDPPLEVAERADAYLIAADLPGVREDQLELNFENNVLTIRGSRTPSFSPSAERTLRVHVSERPGGTFERSVRLPEYVEGDRIEARLVDGVLQVTVPKSPAAQPRKIAISSAGRAVRIDGGAQDGRTE